MVRPVDVAILNVPAGDLSFGLFSWPARDPAVGLAGLSMQSSRFGEKAPFSWWTARKRFRRPRMVRVTWNIFAHTGAHTLAGSRSGDPVRGLHKKLYRVL